MSHTPGEWAFTPTTCGDGSTAYAVKSAALGYIVAYAQGQTDAEALANAQRIAAAVSEINQRDAISKATGGNE